ncbi:MAG: chemotaxis protein CheB [Phormidesmis sp.]
MADTHSNPNPSSESEATFPIVGIGASAGGIEACSALLHELPAEPGMAFVVVQHLGADSPRMLSQILGRKTEMPIAEVEHDTAIQLNHVYVIPPNVKMTIREGRLQLAPRDRTQKQFMSIDIFFKSLAENYRYRAIGVVLSGLDGDGAEGLKQIKQAGGITFAQTENTAQFSGMPNTAIETGEVDFILSPDAIARELVNLTQHPYLAQPSLIQASQSASQSDPQLADERHLLTIYTLLKAVTGVNFNQYKRTTFERRLRRRMALYKVERLEEYVAYLQDNPAEITALYHDVLITVTSFFRDPPAFVFLKEAIFPSLIEQKGLDASIRIWVAGCATGEECYSLAICLFELLSAQNINLSIQIFGTDISEAAIDIARQGVYPENRMTGVSPERRQRFFTYTEGRYQISKAVRELCIFARQNLVSDPPFSNIDLVSCRNVLIYFAPILQKRIRSIFHYSLNPEGFLWLGSSESISENSDLFTAVNKQHSIYGRSLSANRLSFDFITSDHAALSAKAPNASQSPENRSYATIQRQADQIVLNRYAPVGIIINEQLEILHFRGNTSAYLRPAPGEPSFNLLKMVQPSLQLELRAAIEQAKAQDTIARRERLQLEDNPRYIQIEVTPIKNPLSSARSYLVLFEEGPLILADQANDDLENNPGSPSVSPTITRLEQELAVARQELLDTQAYLQATIEEHDATNQRLTTANEEILSSNEELQSTNEELQTAKEEIQAANEELKTTNEELQSRNSDTRASNDDLLNLLNNVQVPVVMLSNDLRIRRFTPNAQTLFNLIATDAGRPISDIRTNLDLPDFETLILEVIETLAVQEREVQDSAGHWYQLRIRPYRTADNRIDGAVITLIDIDTIKRTLQQLESARLYAERIVETVREPLVVVNEARQVVTANPGFYETFQVSAKETEGRSLFELGNGQWNLPELRTALDNLFTHNIQIQEFEVEHDFEQIGPKTVLLSAREIEQSTDGRLILLAIEDITERKQAEAERIQLAQAQAARQEAEAANTSKDEFLSVLSHELRTPLNTILGWTSILLRTQPDPTLLNRALTSIDRSTRTQSRIIEDLLEVSRIIQGQLELRQQSVDLTALMSGVIEGMLPAAEQAGVRLAAALDETPGHFYFDPDRLRQVFNNVISNAIKFTPSGGQIHTRLTYTPDQAKIEIADTGSGIEAEFLPHVFDRFCQVNSSNTRQYGGLGLGLAIVKTFVEAHGGKVRISSPGIGEGTTLTIMLPLVAAIAPISTATPTPTGDNLLTGLCILVVEDNPDNLEILTMMLEVQGATVIAARSVAEAMSLLVAENAIGLLISDISLPGEDGFDLIRQVRAASWGEGLPAIAVTGYAAASDTEKIFRAGFQHHLPKPVEIDELIAAIIDLVA